MHIFPMNKCIPEILNLAIKEIWTTLVTWKVSLKVILTLLTMMMPLIIILNQNVPRSPPNQGPIVWGS